MPENHIQRLMRERDELHAMLRDARDELRDIMHYLQTPKFHGPDNDYVHVRTDMMPKLISLSFTLIER